MRKLAAIIITCGSVLTTVACGGSDGSGPPPLLIGGPETPASSPRASAEATKSLSPEPSPAPTRTPVIVSLSWLSADLPVLPLPAAFAARSPDAGLQSSIESALAGREGSYSVVVHNLADGRYAAVNEGSIYYAASLYKLALLLEAYRQRDSGELDFSHLLTLEKKYVEYDLGTLELLGLIEGDMVSVADAVRAMIVVSDTPTAVMMQDTLGPDRVDATLRLLGITQTETANRDLPATARDMARLLAAVAAGEGVSETSRVEMLSLIQQESYREGILAGLPPDTAVAHKTGSFNDATHDVALVWGPGGPYIIAVMTDRSYDWQAIQEVSRAVWDYFAADS